MTAYSFDAAALTHLESLHREELSERFEELFGRDVPKRMSRPILIRALAYRIQENADGGPNRALMRRLDKMARELQDTGTITSVPVVQIKPGTRFLRDWQGDTHRVTVTEGGFLYRNQNYKSLSAIARQITGTNWSGPAFFGLKERQRANGGREWPISREKSSAAPFTPANPRTRGWSRTSTRSMPSARLVKPISQPEARGMGLSRRDL